MTLSEKDIEAMDAGKMDLGQKIRFVAQTYGKKKQAMQAIEEMSELTKELCKFLRFAARAGAARAGIFELDNEKLLQNYRNIVEEIADVKGVMEQLEYMFSSPGEINFLMEQKLDRQIMRIQDGKE